MTTKVSVHFERRSTFPTRLLAEAELRFEGGLLDGLRLVGFSVWRAVDGGTYVTVPARSWAVSGGDRRFYDLLRPTLKDDAEPMGRFKDAVLAEWAALCD